MGHIEHTFDVGGVEHTAKYRDSATLEEINSVNNGEQLTEGKDGLKSASIIWLDSYGLEQNFDYCNFENNDETAKIPSTHTIREYKGSVINASKPQKAPVLSGQDYYDFYMLQLPEGLTLAHAINIKMCNYQLNFRYGSDANNYKVRCFDEATLEAMQPIVFTVSQTVLTETGGTIEINVTDSSGDLEYSLNDSYWQDENVFSGLTVGEITVYVRDGEEVKNSRTFVVQQSV